MKFGKSLTEKVRDDWKDYAVAYKAMKKALPKDDPDFFPHDAGGVDDQDGKDVNPESVYPQYWQLYAESLSSVTDFYSQKSNSATTEIKTLQSKVEKYRLSKLPGSTLSSTITVEDLMKQVTDAKIELQHVREFLSINYTAFSKILKKYDKRTFSSLREKKLEEILRDNPFLDDNAMDGFIYRVQQLINSLDEVEGRPKSCSSSNRSNVNRMEDTGRSLINHQESGSIFQQSKIILDKIEDSPFFAKYKAKRIPRFLPDEIEDGAFLGEGEFSVVKEVKAFHVNDLCPICVIHQLDSGDGADFPTDNGRQREPSTAIPIENFTMSIRADNASSQGDSDSFQDDHQEEDTEVEANRGFMMHHCLRSGSARYAIKQLKSSLSGTKRADGAIDLSIEAKFLSVLSHPNIIKLCGLGGSRGHPRSFIVLDRLYATLDVKIRFWKAKENDCKGFLGFKKHKSQLKVLWNERLLAGFDISRAIKYLHKHEIIYRDLVSILGTRIAPLMNSSSNSLTKYFTYYIHDRNLKILDSMLKAMLSCLTLV
jgi:serine/threonine protein kinase